MAPDILLQPQVHSVVGPHMVLLAQHLADVMRDPAQLRCKVSGQHGFPACRGWEASAEKALPLCLSCQPFAQACSLRHVPPEILDVVLLLSAFLEIAPGLWLCKHAQLVWGRKTPCTNGCIPQLAFCHG